MPQAPAAVEPASTGQPRATDRGLALVSTIADHPSGLTLADAARAVDLPMSTALRQLRSLEANGFAERHDDGRYHPGPELFRIARSLMTASLPQRAQPVLDALAGDIGESAYLAEPVDARTATYSAMAPGRHAVRHVSWLGQQVTRRETAVGAALGGRVDADGAVAVSDAVEDGVTALSAPVRAVGGQIIGALSIVGPSFRLRGKLLSSARAVLAAAATELSDPGQGSRRRKEAAG